MCAYLDKVSGIKISQDCTSEAEDRGPDSRRTVTSSIFNTLRPRQNGHYIAANIFKCIFFNEYPLILIQISLKFVSKNPITNMPALVQIMTWCWRGDKPMAWRWWGDKPLSEQMMVYWYIYASLSLNELTYLDNMKDLNVAHSCNGTWGLVSFWV